MKKTIKLTESDLSRILKKIINEQSTSKHSYNHPMYNNFYKQMIKDIEGDGVVLTYTSDELVISAFGNIYTITKTKQKMVQ